MCSIQVGGKQFRGIGLRSITLLSRTDTECLVHGQGMTKGSFPNYTRYEWSFVRVAPVIDHSPKLDKVVSEVVLK